jgi:hypothetical protein
MYKVKIAEGEAVRVSYEREVQRLGKLVGEYEGQFGLVRVELERVNGNLKNKVDEVHGLEDRLRVQNEELRRKVQETEFLLATKQPQYEVVQQGSGNGVREPSPRTLELQNKLLLASQEVERLNNVVRVKSQEVAGWQEEAESAKRKLVEQERASALQFALSAGVAGASEESKSQITNYGTLAAADKSKE